MEEKLFRAVAIKKSYKDFTLDDVSFEVGKGEILVA